MEIEKLKKEEQNLVEFMKSKMTAEELEMFKDSFLMYLKYDSKKDFVVDLDEAWKWLGFSRIDHAKTTLKNSFKENVEYVENTSPQGSGKVSDVFPRSAEQKIGRPKIQTLMTVNCFKKLCLKSATKKADEIHDYFIKLEELSFEYAIIQKENENKKAIERAISIEKEKHLLEKAKNTSGIYWLVNYDLKLCKYGSSNNIYERVKNHKSGEFKDFYLDNFMQTLKYIDLERRIHPYSNTSYNSHKEIMSFSDISDIHKIYINIEKENRLLESYSDKDLKNELLRLENENLKLKNIQKSTNLPKLFNKTSSSSAELTEQEKTNFKNFLENNVKLYQEKTNPNPLKIQSILDSYLLIPIVSTSVKNKYTKVVEEFIQYKFPRHPFSTTKRKLNGVSTRGWYSFILSQELL